MNRIAGVMKTQLRDRFGWIFLPWIIMLSSFVVNLIIGYMIQDDSYYTGGLASIYVYTLVLGIMSVIQTFPFVLGFGVRRKDYFWGTAASISAVSAVSAFALWLLSFVENKLTGGWGVNMHFFHLPYISDGMPISQIWVSFSLMIHVFFLGFIISCIYRRLGRVGLYTFFILLLMIITVASYLFTYYNIWGTIGNWLAGFNSVEVASGLFGISLLYALIAYLLLRRSTV